jgi:hypothetical protein
VALFSIGHSNYSQEDFTASLKGRISTVIDVRSHPESRWAQYERREMQRWLPEAGIGYEWWPGLGGWDRRHERYRNAMARHGVDLNCYLGRSFPKQRIGRSWLHAGTDPTCPLHGCNSRIGFGTHQGTRVVSTTHPAEYRLELGACFHPLPRDQAGGKQLLLPHIQDNSTLGDSRRSAVALPVEAQHVVPLNESGGVPPQQDVCCSSRLSEFRDTQNKASHDLSASASILNISSSDQAHADPDVAANDKIGRSFSEASAASHGTLHTSKTDQHALWPHPVDTVGTSDTLPEPVVLCTCDKFFASHPESTAGRPVWNSIGLWDYSYFMTLPEFLEDCDRLIERGKTEDLGFMCCEATWWRCHRSLISDYLIFRGIEVQHLMPHYRQKNKVRFVDGFRLTPHSQKIGNRLERYELEIVKAWETWASESCPVADATSS